jgi:hypothetical protein
MSLGYASVLGSICGNNNPLGPREEVWEKLSMGNPRDWGKMFLEWSQGSDVEKAWLLSFYSELRKVFKHTPYGKECAQCLQKHKGNFPAENLNDPNWINKFNFYGQSKNHGQTGFFQGKNPNFQPNVQQQQGFNSFQKANQHIRSTNMPHGFAQAKTALNTNVPPVQIIDPNNNYNNHEDFYIKRNFPSAVATYSQKANQHIRSTNMPYGPAQKVKSLPKEQKFDTDITMMRGFKQNSKMVQQKLKSGQFTLHGRAIIGQDGRQVVVKTQGKKPMKLYWPSDDQIRKAELQEKWDAQCRISGISERPYGPWILHYVGDNLIVDFAANGLSYVYDLYNLKLRLSPRAKYIPSKEILQELDNQVGTLEQWASVAVNKSWFAGKAKKVVSYLQTNQLVWANSHFEGHVADSKDWVERHLKPKNRKNLIENKYVGRTPPKGNNSNNNNNNNKIDNDNNKGGPIISQTTLNINQNNTPQGFNDAKNALNNDNSKSENGSNLDDSKENEDLSTAQNESQKK